MAAACEDITQMEIWLAPATCLPLPYVARMSGLKVYAGS